MVANKDIDHNLINWIYVVRFIIASDWFWPRHVCVCEMSSEVHYGDPSCQPFIAGLPKTNEAKNLPVTKVDKSLYRTPTAIVL